MLLSGVIFMHGSNASIGIQVCLWCSILFVLLSCLTSLSLPLLNNSDFFEKDSTQAQIIIDMKKEAYASFPIS